MSTTVLLIDDHPIVRRELRTLLAGDAITVTAEAASGEEGLMLAAYLRPTVVLCDLRLGDGIDGIQTTAALRTQDPAPTVLILTTVARDAEITAALDAGAAECLFKESAPEQIVDGMQRALSGEVVLPPGLSLRP